MTARVVLLGASNLAQGLPVALAAARARLGPGPLEVLVAAGHGRSYGQWSRVFVRGLPGILDCGVWGAARRARPLPTYALVTDPGNDLAYGAAPADLAGWVSRAAEQLLDLGADVVLTLLPGRSLDRLRPWQYGVWRTLLFPRCRVPFATMLGHVAEVNASLADLAGRRGIAAVEPDPDWYGRDRIHIRPVQRPAAWRALCARWRAPHPRQPDPPARPRLGWLRTRPAHETVLGVAVRRRQPVQVFPDGTTLSLY